MVSALVSIALLPSPASSQSLHLAELFAEQGRIDDARAEVLAWFEIRGDEATPNEVQHGLWLRGRFAKDPAAGLADLDRLVDDYPDGPYTGHALAWLASAAAESGDDARAAALYTRVAQSHAESEPASAARDWLRQRGITVQGPEQKPETREKPAPVPTPPPPADTFSPRAPAPADSAALPPVVVTADSTSTGIVDSLPSAAAETGEPPLPVAAAVVDSVTVAATEILDSVPVAAAAEVEAVPTVPTEPAPPLTAPADSSPVREVAPIEAAAPPPAVEPEPEPEPERIPPGPPVPGAATAGSFAVQIGAFRNPVGAAGLVDELITAGFDARLVQVPINDLLRVRIGRFVTLEEAQAELARVRAAGRDGAVVNDARRETQVR
jgi:cell division septation protein DedD